MSILRFSCQQCNGEIHIKSKNSISYVCPSCFSGYKLETGGMTKVHTTPSVPEDMTPLKIGTTGKYDSRNFEIIGRIRYQYDEGYLNQWNVLFDDGKSGYLGEAYGGFSVYEKMNYKFELNKISHVSIFKIIDFPEKKKFSVTAISNNTGYSCEGELYDSSIVPIGFVSIELSGAKMEMAMINVYAKQSYEVFLGKFFDFEELKFKNSRELNEWI